MKGTMEAPSSPGKGPVQLRDCIEELLNFTLRSHIDGNLDLRLSIQFSSSLLQPISHHSDSIGASQCPRYSRLAVALYESIASRQVQAMQDSLGLSGGDVDLLHRVDWKEAVHLSGSELENILKTVTFELHVQEPFFKQLKEGLKTIEGRCAVSDYNRISPGSLILFNKSLVMEVQSICHYDSFLEMLKAEGLTKVLPSVKSLEEGVQVYRNFYTEDKEMSNGVLAMHVTKLANQPYLHLANILSRLGCKGVESLLGETSSVSCEDEK